MRSNPSSSHGVTSALRTRPEYSARADGESPPPPRGFAVCKSFCKPSLRHFGDALTYELIIQLAQLDPARSDTTLLPRQVNIQAPSNQRDVVPDLL